ncbi:MAG: hypothetical protein ACTSPS_03645 [Promethearchaeota archaeon]
MNETLEKIENLISETNINTEKLREVQINFMKKELKALHCVDKFLGDFPTFIEPVHLGIDVKIGDDVLLGPNVYIGDNCEIGDYCELANTILFDNVSLGENFKLENCIIVKESKLKFNNISAFSCVLSGQTDSKENLKKISF